MDLLEPIIESDISEVNSDEFLSKRRFNALILIGIVLPFLLFPFLCILFIYKGEDLLSLFVTSRVIIWASLGIMFLYASKAEMQDFFLWEERPYQLSFIIVSVIVLFLLGFGAGIISRIPEWFGFRESNVQLLKYAIVFKQNTWLIYATSITAAITEEFFFRGYVMSRLSLFFKNRHWPVLISALLFMTIHYGYKTIHELIFTLLIGLIYGYYYDKYRNIKALIITHFLVDWVALSVLANHKFH